MTPESEYQHSTPNMLSLQERQVMITLVISQQKKSLAGACSNGYNEAAASKVVFPQAQVPESHDV